MLALQLFDSCSIRVNGGVAPRLRTRTGYHLLGLLALRYPRPVERAYIAAALWPGSEHDQAMYNLRRALSDLRRVLGMESSRLESPASYLVRLNLEGADCDLLRFDRAFAAGRYDEAVAAYGGPLLKGCFDDWVLPERDTRKEHYATARQLLAAEAATGQNLKEAEGHLRAALALLPERESLTRDLMALLDKAGDTPAAVQAYRQLQRFLRENGMGSPSTKTQALYAHIVRRRGVPEKRPAEHSFLSTADIPPLRACPAFSLTALIGRDTERETVCERLLTARLLTLTGAGGVGKTRLSLAVAEALQQHFADGVHFIDLTCLQTPERFAAFLAQELHPAEGGGENGLPKLLRLLRDRELLLVLDNCEHLLPDLAPHLKQLLLGCPQLTVLATSREPLGIGGEILWRVPSLDLSAARDLFFQRVAQADPTFRPTSLNGRALDQLLERLDGIPLAIELAASRIGFMSLEELTDQLADRFAVLRHPDRTLPLRQQTLQAAIAWSVDRLDTEERMVFRRLAVFAGSWTADMAISIISGHGISRQSIPDVLERLQRKSLLQRVSPSGVAPTRFRYQEIIREFAAKELTSTGEQERLFRRHLAYFLRNSRYYAHRYGEGRKQRQFCMDYLSQEQANLSKALDRSRERSWLSREVRLAGPMALWLWRTEQWTQARDYLLDLFERATRGGIHLPMSLGTCRYYLADIYHELGNGSESEQQAEWAIACFERQGVDHRVFSQDDSYAVTLRLLGIIHLSRGNTNDARRYFQETLAIYERWQELDPIYYSLCSLGDTALLSEDFSDAESYYRRFLTSAQTHADAVSQNFALRSLGQMEMFRGDLKAAESYFRQSLQVVAGLSEPWCIASSYGWMARLALARGESLHGCSLFDQSIALVRSIGTQWPLVTYLLWAAEAYVLAGDISHARTLLQEAVVQAKALGHPDRLRYLLLQTVALLSARRGDYATAVLLRSAAERNFKDETIRHHDARLNDLQGITAWLDHARAALTRREEQSTAETLSHLTDDQILYIALTAIEKSGDTVSEK